MEVTFFLCWPQIPKRPQQCEALLGFFNGKGDNFFRTITSNYDQSLTLMGHLKSYSLYFFKAKQFLVMA